MFEDLGLKYLGPIDGHDEPAVESALRKARAFSPSDDVARRDDSHASRWARWTVAMVSSSSML